MNRPRYLPAAGRMRSRGSLPFGSRPPSLWRRLQRGQTLVMFVLSVTMLVGLAGLAIDVVRAYDLFAREHRAAEAGALAGVLYMPCDYSPTVATGGCGPGTGPDGNSGISRAMLEVQKNGFGQGVTPPASCVGADISAPVTVCTTTISTTSLEVTITQPINVFFLSVLGINSFNVTATAAADYLPPTILGVNPGSGGNVWGAGGVSNPKTFLDVINGPAEFQEQGDPFVYCQDGLTTGPPADADFSTLPYTLQDSATGTVAGLPFTPASGTNHKPFAGGPECGNAKDPNNLQPPGFGGQFNANSDVYDFYLSAPVAADVYIWNPSFDPSDAKSSCNGAQTPDVFFVDQACNSYYAQYGPITSDGIHFDDPRLYFNMTYSVYHQDPAYSGSGIPVISYPAPPIDAFKADTALHCSNGSNGTGYPLPAPPAQEGSTYDGPLAAPVNCQALNGPGFMVGQWAKIGSVAAGSYRLTAEATPWYLKDQCGNTYVTCGWGRHTFSVAVCAAGTAPSGNSCPAPTDASGKEGFVAPLNDADIYLNFPSGTQNGAIPIAWIPADFAGKTITLSVFNAGYTRANAPNSYFTIVPPDCSPINIPPTTPPDPTWYRVTQSPGTPTAPPCAAKGGGPYNWVYSSARGKGGTTYGDFIYHGLWVDIPITLPSSYTGGQWWFDEQVSQGAKDFGQICLKASISGGSPIHLIL